jgi:hypothetical protein
LSGGYFPSRSTIQFAVIESRKTSAEIAIGAATKEGKLPVTNRLGVQILRLFVCDDQKRFFGTADLAAGEFRELPEIDPRLESLQWSALKAEHRPEYPKGFDPYQVENVSRIFGTHPFAFTASAGKPTFSKSIMEQRLRDVIEGPGLEPRTYIAHVAQGPEVSIGTEAAAQASFHVVLGSW